MNKLKMAHEWAIETMRKDGFQKHYMQETVRLGWEYADAMQAEADKREVSIEEMMKDHVHDYIYGRVCACGAVNGAEKEWQPDWSQAPKGVEGWKANPEGTYSWTSRNGGHVDSAPSFGYQGNWQDSLRKRPQ